MNKQEQKELELEAISWVRSNFTKIIPVKTPVLFDQLVTTYKAAHAIGAGKVRAIWSANVDARETIREALNAQENANR